MLKSDKLFVTEAECAERIGISTVDFKSIVSTLAKSGFPAADPLFKNRRYWPAVRAWIDCRYNLNCGSGPCEPDEVEPWRKSRPDLNGQGNCEKPTSASRRRS